MSERKKSSRFLEMKHIHRMKIKIYRVYQFAIRKSSKERKK